jgi:hypothetical protein
MRDSVNRRDGRRIRVARTLGQVFVCADACCCGRLQDGYLPVPRELHVLIVPVSWAVMLVLWLLVAIILLGLGVAAWWPTRRRPTERGCAPGSRAPSFTPGGHLLGWPETLSPTPDVVLI